DQQLERRRVTVRDESCQQFGIAHLGTSVRARDVAEVADDALKLTGRHGIPLAAVNVLFSPYYFPEGDDLLRDFSSGPSPGAKSDLEGLTPLAGQAGARTVREESLRCPARRRFARLLGWWVTSRQASARGHPAGASVGARLEMADIKARIVRLRRLAEGLAKEVRLWRG